MISKYWLFVIGLIVTSAISTYFIYTTLNGVNPLGGFFIYIGINLLGIGIYQIIENFQQTEVKSP
jgi:hypothetical protein